METIKLSNGLGLPQVGLGTWQINNRSQMLEVLGSAYENGYRLIDTAAAYSNEMAIGKAIEALEVNRDALILSDKVWNTSRGFEAVQEACKKSLKKLKTDYLDMYLIHWPASMKLYSDWIDINSETWRGMEQLYKEGWVKAIGVCNFKIHHLQELEKTAEIMPMVNQFEIHPGMNQEQLIQFCQNKGIQVEASSPLGNGKILNNEKLIEIAEKLGKTVAQVCLRWEIQKNVIVLPKTTNISRLQKNIDVFDFILSDEDMRTIDMIPYCGGIGIDSDEVVEFG